MIKCWYLIIKPLTVHTSAREEIILPEGCGFSVELKEYPVSDKQKKVICTLQESHFVTWMSGKDFTTAENTGCMIRYRIKTERDV